MGKSWSEIFSTALLTASSAPSVGTFVKSDFTSKLTKLFPFKSKSLTLLIRSVEFFRCASLMDPRAQERGFAKHFASLWGALPTPGHLRQNHAVQDRGDAQSPMVPFTSKRGVGWA